MAADAWHDSGKMLFTGMKTHHVTVSKRWAMWLGAFVAFPLGCSTETESAYSDRSSNTTAGADVAGVESDIEAIASSLISETGGSLDLTGAGGTSTAARGAGSGEAGLQALGEGAATFYTPAGCVTVNKLPELQKVTYRFENCAGKLGLTRVSGILIADYSKSTTTELRVSLESRAFRVNRALVDFSASANVTANGTKRTMVWTASLSGTTGRGRAFVRTGNKTISWTTGEQCISVSGQSQGTMAGQNVTVVIENYEQCANQCPEPGGSITLTDTDESVSILVLDGGRARITIGESSSEFQLPCTDP